MSVQKQEDKPGEKYNGSKLRSDIAHMLANPEEVLKADILKGRQETVKKPELKKAVIPKTQTIKTVKPAVKPQPPKVRVGYKKLIVTIPEDLARTILNYAGHSASKQATIQIWYAEGKQPQADTDPKTVSPVYPLFNL